MIDPVHQLVPSLKRRTQDTRQLSSEHLFAAGRCMSMLPINTSMPQDLWTEHLYRCILIKNTKCTFLLLFLQIYYSVIEPLLSAAHGVFIQSPIPQLVINPISCCNPKPKQSLSKQTTNPIPLKVPTCQMSMSYRACTVFGFIRLSKHSHHQSVSH